MIPVTTAPLFNPDHFRTLHHVPVGLTIDAIIALALPGIGPAERGNLRVTLVTPQGMAAIQPQHWRSVQPKSGVHVVIRLVPDGDDALRSILQIVVAVAVVAFAGPLAGLIVPGLGAVGVALVQVGLTIVGGLLVNALVPPPKADDTKRRDRYAINSWRNQVAPDGAVPVVLGRMRYAPPFAAISYSEIVGDWQYIRTLFNFGYGPVELTDFRIGETSISEFDEVEIEVRTGLPDDAPVTLYPSQVVEENVGAELVRPLPRNDRGDVVDGSAIATPIIRTTGADAASASVIIAFPAGLIRYSSKGDAETATVSVRIEQRPIAGLEWQLVETLKITGKKLDSFFRQHTWQFETRGRYQIRLTMLTAETEDPQVQQRCTWAVLQTLRPEYPLAFTAPLALVAVRIKATHQLNGSLDQFTALATRPCLDWDHETSTWVERVTTNPASLYCHVLQSTANPKPVPDAGLDLVQIVDWHDFCRLNTLTYSSVLDGSETTLREVLAEIAGAGRAMPRHDGLRWGVTIDRPGDLIMDHIGPRNSWGFKSTRTYIDPPHAFRIKFRDADNDYAEAERLVRWPEFEGDIELTEVLEMPGMTDAAEVWRAGRRRQYEAIYRPDTYEVTQDGSARVATRGDLVVLSNDVIDQVQKAVRVRSVSGPLIEIDDAVEMTQGETYGLRFRIFADGEDTVGMSVVRTVLTVPGETGILTLTGTGESPMEGDLILFGLAGSEAYQMIVANVESATDRASIVRLIDAAPVIDELLAADEVPAWSSRIGAELDDNLTAPPVPRFVSVLSGFIATGDADLVEYLIAAGSGVIPTAQFEIDHRLVGASVWITLLMPVANGGGALTEYTAGDQIEIEARAVSPLGISSGYTPIVTLTVGENDAGIPAALEDASVSISVSLGGASIQVATGTDATTTALQLYRSASPSLDRDSDAVGSPIAVAPHQSYTFAIGDSTRKTLIADGGLDSPGAWGLGTGWSISGGLASHAAGIASDLAQAAIFTSGKFYRVSGLITGRSAGSLTPAALGGTDRLGTAVAIDGRFSDRIQAVTGNNTCVLRATSDFDGAVDDLAIYLETSACLAQGTHYLWVEPQNADGIPGPTTGPFTITIY